ncbi:hypothetical protein Dsin_032816 [Dipteronia sinensis]|uniref:DUF8040 domain-containing protein n=1 Tax=Dipteronia sinensis TaxID=43782 RepID=A0AAE0DLA3_9ROSI|nr:hypothetical protein Dsin_032816 [Dipteronia sinensis]
MDAPVFLNLCQTLEQSQLLEDDRHVTVIEAVGMCLYILSHGAVMRVVVERFQQSKDTVYRQFKSVLKGLCGLTPNIILERTRGQHPPPLEIRNNPKFYPYFKKCIGAIDGTHIVAFWEGTANHSKVFLDAIGRQENGFPHPNEGYYYVVDSGYINMSGFLTPYKGNASYL